MSYMGIRRNKVKPGKNGLQLGNFVIREEDMHVKVIDVSGVHSHRVGNWTTKGAEMVMLLEGARNGDEKMRDILQNYCVVMYNLMCCVVDGELLKDVNDATMACIGRNGGMFGQKSDIGKDEDDEILEQVKAVAEVEEKLKEEAEDGR